MDSTEINAFLTEFDDILDRIFEKLKKLERKEEKEIAW